MSERLETGGFQAFLDFEIRCADCTKMRGKFGKDDVLRFDGRYVIICCKMFITEGVIM